MSHGFYALAHMGMTVPLVLCEAQGCEMELVILLLANG